MATRTNSPSLAALNLQPKLNQELETVWLWLEANGLTARGRTMDVEVGSLDPDSGQCYDGASVAIAQATQRHPVIKNTQHDLKIIKERFKDTVLGLVDQNALWGAVKHPKDAIRALQWQKLPADAMAFYRPFHYPPFDQWGIYLLVGPLVRYHQRLQKISANLKLFSPEVLMHLVLFEVFNHEFFHHLTESTVTSLEILSAVQGKPTPLFLKYKQRQRSDGFGYPHAPLEEALANAYAYNALTFISRIKAGYKTATVRVFQEAIKKHWHLEPPGYRAADFYIQGEYVHGGAHLLSHMLGEPGAADTIPLSNLAKNLMPSGFMAMKQKPDIPTYLVGTDVEISLFNTLVPAPNEAYTQLFWPYNTTALDRFIEKKKEEEKAMRQAAKQAAAVAQGGLPFE